MFLEMLAFRHETRSFDFHFSVVSDSNCGSRNEPRAISVVKLSNSFEGRLLDVPPKNVAHWKFNAHTSVSVSGKRYKFQQLEKDGTFVLGKDW